ncbi:MAG: hypothetical protein WB523_01745 [Candidatus Sulfotelmatobacter sp.]
MTMVTCHRRLRRPRPTIRHGPWQMPVTPQALTRTLQDFLSEAAGALVLENGAVAFDLAQSKYSISGEHNRCLLHLWSAERNAVRRVLEAEVKNGTLRLAVQRMGQARPSRLEICRDRDRRSPSTRRAGRAAYEQKLRRTLERHFPEFKIIRLTSGVDLEKSFGPIYARGLIRRGHSAFAILGVNGQETQSSIDAALTFGILWLDVCRSAQPANVLAEGLKLFVPAGTSSLVRERMTNLNRDAAKWLLFELDERHDALVQIDCTDRGNVSTRLVHATDGEAVHQRFGKSIAAIQEVLPGCEVCVLSAAETVFRWRGLEFARARLSTVAGTFHSIEEIIFGVGAEERVLEKLNEAEFCELVHCLRDTRHPYGPRQNRCGACAPNAGWSRWLSAMLAWWMTAWMHRASIRRFPHSPPPIAP